MEEFSVLKCRIHDQFTALARQVREKVIKNKIATANFSLYTNRFSICENLVMEISRLLKGKPGFNESKLLQDIREAKRLWDERSKVAC